MSKFIVIEGLIGVGKTTLCKLIQREWNAKLVLEPAEDNPFLASFYADPKRYAFPTQMFYLASRYAQQIGLHQYELFDELVVSDYLYAKDRLFAKQTLDTVELSLYDRFANLLDARLARPEFVLFLDSPTELIISRIDRRGIEAEQVIEPEYLDNLRAAYYELWDWFRACPVYVVDTSEINYVDDPDDAARMLAMIHGWLEGVPVPGAPPAHARPAHQLAMF